MKKTNKEKADKLIQKGDKLMEKGKWRRALKKYRKAKEHDPERLDIYDKLIEAHDRATKKWGMDDLAESVNWAMEKQELQFPELKLVHEQLKPEWSEITEKISALITCSSDEEEKSIIKEIHEHGSDAVSPLIWALMQIKKGSGEKQKNKEEE